MKTKKLYNLIKQKNNLKKRSLDQDCANIKREVLFQNKFSVENILKMIKNIQNDCISSKPSESNMPNIKQTLSLFKENLAFILNKKKRIYTDNLKENEKKKEDLRNMIYSKNDETDARKINYQSEKEQLKLLNFQIENEIENTDFLIKQKNKLIENGYEENLSEPKYNYEKESKGIIHELMNNHKNEINQKLIKLTMQKSEKESELEVVLDYISQIKNKINKIKIDKIKDKFNSPANNIYEKKSKNFSCQILHEKIQENICVKNISEFNVDLSNKETNDTNSIKNYNDLNFIKLFMEHPNYGYLKNKIFYNLDNDEPLKSFNSSLDCED